MLMIDGGCGKQGPGTSPCMESRGNGSTGGVTAWPEDLSDPLLTNWTKRGPTVFVGCGGASGPSPVRHNAQTGAHELIAIRGGHEALFVATDGSLAAWALANETFLPARGGGGGLWHALPPSVDATAGFDADVGVGVGRWATHIMQLNSVLGDGAATFALMHVDDASSTASNLTASAALDLGPGVRYGQLSLDTDEDPRTVHVSWLSDARRSGKPGAPCDACPQHIHSSQLTCFRSVRFDGRLGPRGALVEVPVVEYYSLRRAVLAATTAPVPLPPAAAATTAAAAPATVFELPAGPLAADMEINVTLPSGAGAGVGGAFVGSISVGLGCDVDGGGGVCALHLNFTVGAPAPPAPETRAEARTEGARPVTMSVVLGSGRPAPQQASFPLLPGEGMLPLRVLLDMGSVEVFAAHGRGVYSGGLGWPAGRFSVTAVAAGAPGAAVEAATAWAMAPIRKV